MSNSRVNLPLYGTGRVLVMAASLLVLPCLAQPDEIRTVIVTNNLVLDPGAHAVRLVIRANHVTIDGRGATLTGPGQVGDPASLENAGVGILAEGVTGFILKDVTVRGFAIGLRLRQVTAASVSSCNFSDNYHNPAHGWGELPARGGILCEQVHDSVFQHNRANRVWDGIHLIESDGNLVFENDFSHCSNTAAKLWRACRNRFLRNNLSYGIRIDRSKGEVHARDSTGVLLETGSDDNYWFQNDMTHGGDGIFIRPLNRWVSRGNVFVENDTSHANNNCVESWSPGNTFIRNKANYGSYGFWLGGSDQTVLIGNEAAFNGLTNGNHNAPEPGFGHGGIVIVGGPSSHTVIQGNHVHDNNGAGIAFRGDVPSQGKRWQTEHWIVQQNRIAKNRYGIWGRWGKAILLAGNEFIDNAEGNYLANVTELIELPLGAESGPAPWVQLMGPATVPLGQTVRFDARASRDAGGRSLNFRWWLQGSAGQAPVLEHTFDRPGFHRLGLTVDNGAWAGLAWRDLLVVPPVAQELGTEGAAELWGAELELNENGRGRVLLENDPDSVVGTQSLRFQPNPYPGGYATVVYPQTRDANWDFSRRTLLRFWIKARNPNVPGFQNAGPVVRLLGENGHVEYKPSKEGNLLNDPPESEGRWLWTLLEIPLAGNEVWTRTVSGEADLARVRGLSLALDAWGYEPFTVWLDGLSVE